MKFERIICTFLSALTGLKFNIFYVDNIWLMLDVFDQSDLFARTQQEVKYKLVSHFVKKKEYIYIYMYIKLHLKDHSETNFPPVEEIIKFDSFYFHYSSCMLIQ